MRQISLILCCLLAITGSAIAAPALSYDVAGNNLVVAAGDGAAQYWQMSFDLYGSRAGRLVGFLDLSGNSDPTYNYAHAYSLGPGMFDPMDAGEMRAANRWTVSAVNQGTSALTFTLSRTVVQGSTGGTAVYSMDWTVTAPTANAGGYNTSIVVLNSFSYDALWFESTGSKGTAISSPHLRLAATVGDEYAFTTATNMAEKYKTAKLTVTGEDERMAESSTFLLTSQWNATAGTYNGLTTGYTSQVTLYAYGHMENDISGLSRGSAGSAGEARLYQSTSSLNISIIPEPATMGLMAVGLAALVIRRRRAL